MAVIRHPTVAKNRQRTRVTFTRAGRPPDVLTANASAADWRPLERALQREFPEGVPAPTESFRFIGLAAGPDDIGTLHVYRHRVTRRYLVLDARGRAYRYEPRMRCYGRVPLAEALERVLRA